MLGWGERNVLQAPVLGGRVGEQKVRAQGKDCEPVLFPSYPQCPAQGQAHGRHALNN